MKNQHPLAFTIMFLALQFMSPLYISLFSKNIIADNDIVMWYAISSGIMACILAAVYSKRERELEAIKKKQNDIT